MIARAYLSGSCLHCGRAIRRHRDAQNRTIPCTVIQSRTHRRGFLSALLASLQKGSR